MPFAKVSTAAWRLAMTAADSPGPGQQIESNTLLRGSLQLSKTTKKTNHVPYNLMLEMSSFIHTFLASL